MFLFLINRIFNIISALIVSYFLVSNIVQFQLIGIRNQIDVLIHTIPEDQHTLLLVLAIAIWLASEVFGLLERQTGKIMSRF